MNHLLRIIVAIAAFTFGINATWMTYSVAKQLPYLTLQNSCTAGVVKPNPIQKRKGKVEVRFVGFARLKNDVFAEIEVVNNSSRSVFYSGYGRGENVSSRIKFNDVLEQPLGMCGTGLSTHEMKPGETMTMKLHGFRFSKYLDKNGYLQIGYYYQSVKNRRGRIIWSEKFKIPGSVKLAIKRNVIIRN